MVNTELPGAATSLPASECTSINVEANGRISGISYFGGEIGLLSYPPRDFRLPVVGLVAADFSKEDTKLQITNPVALLNLASSQKAFGVRTNHGLVTMAYGFGLLSPKQ